jgi:hypothetical protein
MNCGKSDAFIDLNYGDGEVDYVYYKCGIWNALQVELMDLVDVEDDE